MDLPRTIFAALLVLTGSVLARPADAWTREMHIEIARQAATIAPPDLFRQIKRHESTFVAGLGSALDRGHRSPGRSGREILGQIKSGTEATVAAIENHRPFRVIVHNLGRLAILAADANNPLVHSAADPEERSYRGDYERYVASALPRFPLIFYGQGRDVRTRSALAGLIAQMERRSTGLYSLIGREYRRIGTIDGVRLFDDRSTAFGVGSITFSHAVSDLAAIYRYVWLKSGGADRRELPITLPRAEAGPGTEQLGK